MDRARMRAIRHRYRDPLDQVWIETARRIGLALARSREVNASTDGAGTLVLGAPDTLDADDCLAQMIFHELCHSLVEGEGSFGRPDWGLDNQSARDEVREQACLRTQAALAGRHGLRQVLAPTTDHRSFYDALPPAPLAERGEASVVLAIRAVGRAGKPPWGPHLEAALAATAAIAAATAPFDRDGDSLLGSISPAPPGHPGGLPAGATGRCGDCAWRDAAGLCLQAAAPVDAGWPGCERFEPPVDCATCGACCREGYDSVTVDADDPVVRRRPELIVERPTYLEVRRAGPRCAALAGGGGGSPFACVIYDDRPRCCRELEAGGEHCLTARRRVGLSL
jgi:hypothetical protein